MPIFGSAHVVRVIVDQARNHRSMPGGQSTASQVPLIFQCLVSARCNDTLAFNRHRLHRRELIVDSNNFSIRKNKISCLGGSREGPNQRARKYSAALRWHCGSEFILFPAQGHSQSYSCVSSYISCANSGHFKQARSEPTSPILLALPSRLFQSSCTARPTAGTFSNVDAGIGASPNASLLHFSAS